MAEPSPRRSTTSCQPCRRSRLGCGAALRKGAPCSNCERRGLRCVPQGRSQALATEHQPGRRQRRDIIERRQPSHHSPAHLLASSVASGPGGKHSITAEAGASLSLSTRDSGDTISPGEHTSVLHDMLWQIYTSTFESRFAIWFKDSCCPYVKLPPGTKISIAEMVARLDADEAKVEQEQFSKNTQQTSAQAARDNRLLNDALRCAIYAYSARWLPLRSAFQKAHALDPGKAQEQEQNVRDQLWFRARQTLFAAMSRPSYRSILALYLFSLTEMPVANNDPGFNALCTQVLLTHFGTLRSPSRWHSRRPLSQSTTFQPEVLDRQETTPRSDSQIVPDEHDQMRDALFWLGMVCDTSRALINQLPSVILNGGSADVYKVQESIHQRTLIFHQSFQSLQGSQLPLPADIVVVCLEHATACKTVYFSVINQLCEILFHPVTEKINKAAKQILLESHAFHDSLDQLLSLCARDYVTLSVESQLNYVLLLTHYHMGSLILMDTLDSVGIIPEPLTDPIFSRLHACHAIIHALSLALNSHGLHDSSTFGSTLLLDPTPEMTVEALSRCGSAVFLSHRNSDLPSQTAQTMISVLCSALRVYSQISKTASYVLSSFCAISISQNLKVKNDNQPTCKTVSLQHMAVLSACESAFVDQFLEQMCRKGCVPQASNEFD